MILSWTLSSWKSGLQFFPEAHLVFEGTLLWFFKIGIKVFLNKLGNCQPCNWVQLEYTKRLQILAAIYAVFHELSKKFEATEVRFKLVWFDVCEKIAIRLKNVHAFHYKHSLM